jgi:hypothetical protein
MGKSKNKDTGLREVYFLRFAYVGSASANTLFGVFQLVLEGLRRLLLGGVPRWLSTPPLEFLSIVLDGPCQIPFLARGSKVKPAMTIFSDGYSKSSLARLLLCLL